MAVKRVMKKFFLSYIASCVTEQALRRFSEDAQDIGCDNLFTQTGLQHQIQ